MSRTKQILHDLIDEIPESNLTEVLNYIKFIKSKGKMNNGLSLNNSAEDCVECWDSNIKEKY